MKRLMKKIRTILSIRLSKKELAFTEFLDSIITLIYYANCLSPFMPFDENEHSSSLQQIYARNYMDIYDTLEKQIRHEYGIIAVETFAQERIKKIPECLRDIYHYAYNYCDDYQEWFMQSIEKLHEQTEEEENEKLH